MYLALDPQHCFLHIFFLLGPIPRSGGWTWTGRSRSSWTNTAGTPHTLHSVLQRRKKHTIYISVVNPDPVGSGIFSPIRNYLFWIRIQVKVRQKQIHSQFIFCFNCTENTVECSFKNDGSWLILLFD